MKHFLTATAFVLLATQQGLAKESISEIKIVSRDLKSPLCQEMDHFKDSHVREFFRKAKPITAQAMHEYDLLDCHIRGTLKKGSHSFQFDIQPVGLGTLKEIGSDTAQLFGCKNCDGLFPPQTEKH
jgi:hypothetical protein